MNLEVHFAQMKKSKTVCSNEYGAPVFSNKSGATLFSNKYGATIFSDKSGGTVSSLRRSHRYLLHSYFFRFFFPPRNLYS